MGFETFESGQQNFPNQTTPATECFGRTKMLTHLAAIQCKHEVQKRIQTEKRHLKIKQLLSGEEVLACISLDAEARMTNVLFARDHVQIAPTRMPTNGAQIRRRKPSLVYSTVRDSVCPASARVWFFPEISWCLTK